MASPTTTSHRLNNDGLDWIGEILEHFDLSKVERFVVRDGSGASYSPGVWGMCRYPEKGKRNAGYKITCSVKGPFPADRSTRERPLYQNEDGSWPPVPIGCERGAWCESTRGSKVVCWYRLLGNVVLETVEEAVVWIVAHEAFHYLRRTKQIPGRNTEIEADAFSKRLLVAYRGETAPWRMVGELLGDEEGSA